MSTNKPVDEAVLRPVREMLSGGDFVFTGPGPRPSLDDRGVGAVVETSGSTGLGRRVVLSRAALVAAAAGSSLALGKELTWHLALTAGYVAGLMVLVRSLASGREPIQAAGDLSNVRASGNGDAISVVGTQLHRALADPARARALAAFDLVLVGGASLSEELRTRALDAGIPLRESYGMSETCGGIVWDGVALPGSTVRLSDDDRVPRGGRISLSGLTLCDGYLNGSGSVEPATVDGWLETSDWGHMESGRLVVGGRLDDVVISGGVNVDLAAVRRAVERLDVEAAVMAVEDAEWGHRIVLFAAAGGLEQWRERLAVVLPRTSLPRQLVTVDALPRTAGGKPDRRALLALVPR